MYKVPYHYSAIILEAGVEFAVVDGFWDITGPDWDAEAKLLRDSIRTLAQKAGAKISSESTVILTSLTRM